MRLLSYIVVAFCVLPIVFAEHVVINEVFYNPIGQDTGQEFVELFNPTNEFISLMDYTLESGNGANPNDWAVEWTGSSTDIILPNGYFLIGESDVLPTPDAVTDLDLQNSPDAVSIRKNQTIIDVVGYGNLQFSEYFEATPAKNVPEGFSISRSQGVDANNNSADFTQTATSPQSSQQNNLLIQITVEEPELEIVSVDILDEDPNTPGFQIVPVAGGNKIVNLSVKIFNQDGFGNDTQASAAIGNKVYSLSKGFSNSTLQQFSGAIIMSFKDPAGNYSLEISASSGNKVGSRRISFEYLPLAAILLDTTFLNITAQPNTLLQAMGDLDMNTKNKATVRNIGNVDIDIGVKGSSLVSEKGTISPENLELAFGSTFGSNSVTLSTSIQYIPLGLKSDSLKELSYRIFIPSATIPSVYKGFVLITARSR